MNYTYILVFYARDDQGREFFINSTIESNNNHLTEKAVKEERYCLQEQGYSSPILLNIIPLFPSE